MAVFIMLTRPRARPEQLEKLEKDVVKREKDLGKGVTWRANYAVLRPYDHLDICEAPDIEERVRRIVAAAMIASLALGADADDIRPDDGIAAATAAGARSRLRKCWRVAARFETFPTPD